MTATLPTLVTFPREEFLTQRWHYRPGEHVSILGRTQSGKTTLGYQLLEQTTGPQLQGVVLCMKPRDRTVTAWNKQLGYKIVRSWPPLPSIGARPPGFTLWPKHSLANFERDEAMLEAEFRKAIRESYRTKAKRILFADEVHGLSNELDLKRDLIVVWSRGSSMDCGLWGATQRASDVPLWMYSMPTHLFLANEPDARARARFGEIGGVDPELVRRVVMTLGKYQWLYIHRDGPTMCIVDR